MTKRADQLLREAAQYLAAAAQKQAKADIDKWAAAECMRRANTEEGVSLREIAAVVSLSHESVRLHIAAYEYRVSTAVDSFAEAYYAVKESASPEAREDRAVERVARERPEVIERVMREADEKFRLAVGDEVVDGLEVEQRLRDAEYKLFLARRALRDMLALLHESDLEGIRDSWREDFLKTLDDLSMRVDVARSLLAGTLDADLERFLAEV